MRIHPVATGSLRFEVIWELFRKIARGRGLERAAGGALSRGRRAGRKKNHGLSVPGRACRPNFGDGALCGKIVEGAQKESKKYHVLVVGGEGDVLSGVVWCVPW